MYNAVNSLFSGIPAAGLFLRTESQTDARLLLHSYEPPAILFSDS